MNWYSSQFGGTSLHTGLTYSPSITSTTTFYVACTSGGCSSQRTAIVAAITSDPPATPGSISGPTSVCAGTTGISYSISSVPNASGYTWSVSSGWTITSGQGSLSILVTSGTSDGNISVIATSGCGNSSSQDLSVAINATPIITGTTPGSRCGTGSVILGATASAGTINWYSGATGGSSLGTGTSFTTPSILITTTYYVSATVGTCTTASRTGVTATIGAAASTPNVSFVNPPTCAVATGTIGLSSLPGTGTWTLTRNPGGITSTGTGTTTTISGLSADTYTFSVANAAGCTSGTTGNIIITSQPSPPPAPTASTTIQPTCTVATGTIVVTAPIGSFQYNINGGSWQGSTTFSGVASGSHNILVRSSGIIPAYLLQHQ